MPEERRKVICEDCGVEMNHHAEKPVDPINAEEAKSADPALGAIIEEVHACPECGKSHARRLH